MGLRVGSWGYKVLGLRAPVVFQGLRFRAQGFGLEHTPSILLVGMVFRSCDMLYFASLLHHPLVGVLLKAQPVHPDLPIQPIPT